MSRRELLSACACLTAISVAVWFVGCNGSSSNQGGTSGGAGGTGDAPAKAELPPPEPMLDGWTKPAAILVLSGEQHGFWEPCGCSLTQSGGMSRRADMFRQLREREWPITALDLGGTVQRTRLQSKFKFQTVVGALKQLNYAAMALGLEELRLEQSEPGYLTTQHISDPDEPQESLAFLAANVVFFGDPDFGTPLRQKIVVVGDVKIGVTAVFGKGLIEQLLPEGSQSDITIQDPAEVLPAVIDSLKSEQPDLLVLLSHAEMDESRQLTGQFPDFDLVLTAGGPEDGIPKPEQIGKTLMVNVGKKGKNVGVVGYYPDNAEQPLRFELVDLDNRRFAETLAMHDMMAQYQGLLEVNRAEIFEDLPKATHPRGTEFVGAKKCGECHTKAYAYWKDHTRHHHAYASLIEGRKKEQNGEPQTEPDFPWVSRIHDPECLACHVTGWHPQDVYRYESGFVSVDETPLLEAQQCENCHSPGSRHVELEWQWRNDRDQVEQAALQEERQAMKLTADEAKKRVCYGCHDLDNSPNFDFDKYWEKIKHPWRD